MPRLPVMTAEAQAREEQRKTLHDVVELAAKFFEANLASRAGARGRGYLADRGITSTTQLIVARSWRALGSVWSES